MDPTAIHADSWLGIFGSVGLLLAGYIAKRYIIPFLQIGKRQKYAQYIAIIADEVIDELRTKYPERTWLSHLDEAIKILSEICDISPEIAERAVKASAARK